MALVIAFGAKQSSRSSPTRRPPRTTSERPAGELSTPASPRVSESPDDGIADARASREAAVVAGVPKPAVA